MRYIKLRRESDNAILYQIHDAAGIYVRTTDETGVDIPKDAVYVAFTEDADAPAPAWATSEQAGVPEEPLNVPATITKRQFLIQLYRIGMITSGELATAATAPPAAVSSLLALLPAEVAAEATLTWSSMTQVERHSDLVAMAIAFGLMTESQMNDFFIAAAGIQ